MLPVKTLDLQFLNRPGLIAAYALEHANGVVLIESGPGSTFSALEAGLTGAGYALEDVTDLFVTHIHLDHAGAAGLLAKSGAHVHVHHRGYAHLVDPSRLLASATRIYGDQMDRLWGDMLPVPVEQMSSLGDGDEVGFGAFSVRCVDTAGHANHHMAYLVDDICFSGDVGGIRLAGPRYLLMPMPAPEFHLERWYESWRKLSAHQGVVRIAPTHFGVYPDAQAHLELLGATLEETAAWLESTMPGAGDSDLGDALTAWMAERAARYGLTEAQLQQYELANPSRTSAGGILRYWTKYRETAV